MRIVLTVIAILFIAVLAAALVAPPFIDWSAERPRIEAELAKRLGVELSISGPLTVRLLPTPYIEVAHVEIGPHDAPVFVCDRARLELAITALASARARFSAIVLEHARLNLDLEALPRTVALPPLITGAGVDKLVVRGGRVTLRRGGAAPIALDSVDFDGSAGSPAGPFRAGGAVTTADGRRVGFEVASTGIASGGLPIKLGIVDASVGADWKSQFEGALSLKEARVSFQGSAAFSGTLAALDVGGPAPWKIYGVLSADTRGATLDNVTVNVGPEIRALTATGRAEATFTPEPSLTAELNSKQLNIDGLMRRENQDSVSPARALAALAGLARRAAVEEAPMLHAELTFATPTAFIGAQTLENIKLHAKADPGAPLQLAFEAGLPGEGRLKLDGQYEFGASPHFVGALDARASDLAALGAWAAHGDAGFAAKAQALASALPYGLVDARGKLEASKVGFSLRNLTLALDKANLKGAVAFTAPQPDARGRLYVDLSADTLDIEAAPDLSNGAFWFGDFDLSVGLRAARLRIAHAGEAAVESGSLALSAKREGEVFTLDRLTIADLGGASVEAEGALTPASRWARIKLDAARLADFAELLARVAPNGFTRALVTRAASLSPAKATLEARREGGAKNDGFPFDFVTAEGEAGGAHFKVKINDAPAPVSAIFFDADVEAVDGGAFLRPFGLKSPAQPVGRARMNLSGSGGLSAGFDAKLSGNFAGVDVAWKGRIAPNPASPDDPTLFGSATLKSDNILPALVALKLASSTAGIVAPVDISGDFTLRGEKLASPRIGGTIAGAKVAASLNWTSPAAIDASALSADIVVAERVAGEAPPRAGGLTGEVTLDRASASALLSLPLGPLAAAKAGQRWSETKFADPLLFPPLTDLKLRIGSLDLGGVEGKGFSAELKTDRTKFELADAALDVGAAHAAGRAILRRDAAVAAITGAFDVERISVDRPALAGKFGVSVEFASSGFSPYTIVTGLVGQGQLTTNGVTLPKLDPEALDRELAKAQQPDALIDETNVQHALSLELDKRPLPLPDGETAAIVASGALRAGPFELNGPERRATVSGSFDLKTFEFAANSVFESDRVAKFWSGPSPAVTVSLAGPLDAPQRKIDDTAFAAGLAAQALARESDRIATLEADIRERAFFNREKKAWAFLTRRAAEVADYLAEAERIKARAEHDAAEAEAAAAAAVRRAGKSVAVVKRKAAERAAVEAERRAAEQAAAEVKRKADEQAAAEAERKAAEQAAAEAKRKAEEQTAAEAKRKADEQTDEDARRKAENAAVAESLRKAATEAKAKGTLPAPAAPPALGPSPAAAPSDPAAAGVY